MILVVFWRLGLQYNRSWLSLGDENEKACGPIEYLCLALQQLAQFCPVSICPTKAGMWGEGNIVDRERF